RAASSARSPVEESPAAWVRVTIRTARLRIRVRMGRVSPRPAEGISEDQGREAYGVCTLSSGSASSSWAYWTGCPWRYSARQQRAPDGEKRSQTRRGEP